jgi:hypothetical protein
LFWEQKEIRDKQAELARIERLKADPATRIYGERIEAGDFFSDAEIAYAIDPTRLVTCVHLQPIEKAMRQAGIRAYSIDGRTLYARCVIDEARLAQQFSIRPPAYYEPDSVPSPKDPAEAYFICREHRSIIHVIHRHGAYRTPPFPLPDLPNENTD